MAWIGKDGKDDSCRIAALDSNAFAPMLAKVTAAPATRYYRANYRLAGVASSDLTAAHVEFAEKMTLIGYVDAYGATSSTEFFVVFNAASAVEAQALANVSPLAVSGGVNPTIQTLDTGVSIWK